MLELMKWCTERNGNESWLQFGFLAELFARFALTKNVSSEAFLFVKRSEK